MNSRLLFRHLNQRTIFTDFPPKGDTATINEARTDDFPAIEDDLDFITSQTAAAADGGKTWGARSAQHHQSSCPDNNLTRAK